MTRGVGAQEWGIAPVPFIEFRILHSERVMTEDEFQRIKEAEKEHLRTKKRLRRTLKALKRQNRVQDVVRSMTEGARRALQTTKAHIAAVQREQARREAQVDAVLDANEDDLAEADDALRDERAEALVRQYKAASRSRRSDEETSGAPKREPNEPEKTIGRMPRAQRGEDEGES